MASDEFVLAINPDPTKHSVHIEKTKYDIVRDAILDNLLDYGPMTIKRLGHLVKEQLENNFDGSLMWYYTTVKQDMEARGEIRRAPKLESKLKDFDR